MVTIAPMWFARQTAFTASISKHKALQYLILPNLETLSSASPLTFDGSDVHEGFPASLVLANQ